MTNMIDYSNRTNPTDKESNAASQDYMMKQDLPDLETIDTAFFNWVKSLNIFATSPDGWQRVPVVWAGTERSYQIKSDPVLRDRSGTQILPIISVLSTKESKDQTKKGIYWANVPAMRDYCGGTLTVAKRIKPHKSSEFNNNEAYRRTGSRNFRFAEEDDQNEQYVYEYTSIPLPIYITVGYEIHIKTNYEQNIKEILTPFVTYIGAGNDNHFIVEHNKYRFECFLEGDIGDDSNKKNMGADERKFERVINGSVLGYIVGDKKNNIYPNIVKREGITTVSIEMGTVDEIPE